MAVFVRLVAQVTEMIMRRDLVQWQLHVAAGHKIPDTQAHISKSARGQRLAPLPSARDSSTAGPVLNRLCLCV